MKKTASLKLNRDFRRLYAKGNSFAAGNIVVYAMKNRSGINRLGLTVSKKFGNAVSRNRIRRLMRESYRLAENKIPSGYDFIIVARNRAHGKNLSQIQKDMDYSLRQLFKTR